MPKDSDPEEEFGKKWLPLHAEENLTITISPKYRMLWDPNTSENWVHDDKVRAIGTKGMSALIEDRKAKFEEKFVKNAKWMADMNFDDVNKKKAEFNNLVQGEVSSEQAPAPPANLDDDEIMGGVR